MSARASQRKERVGVFGHKVIEKAWDHTVAFFGPQL